MRRSLTLVLGILTALLLSLPLLSTPSQAASGAVKRDQARLDELRCDPGPVDGVVGEWTRAAVIRFQSRHRMAQTGRLDATTRARLHADNAKRCDRRPVPARSGKGRRIVLSQGQNWIWLVRADGSVRAQGGIVDNPAVLSKGSYATGSYCGRAARIERNTTESGTLWLNNFVRFAPCGIGFHQVPTYKSTGQQMHSDRLLGTNFRESHGCIRLSAAVSRKVWRFTTRRTVVRVV